MKRMKWLSLLLAFAMLFVLFTGCSGGGETVKVGLIAPLTGGVAVYGTSVQKAVELYVEQFNAAGGVNGKNIELIEYDDKGEAAEALNAYNKLVSADGAVAIIGPVTSGPTFGVAEASMKDNIPCITATATHPDVTQKYGDNYFRACFEDPFQGGAITTFAVQNLSAKTAAIIYNTSDNYSTGLKDSITAKAGELGLEIVATEGYGKDDVDFNAQLTNIIAKNPEVLFIPEYYNNAYLICSQARSLGFTGTFLGVDGADGVLTIEGADVTVFDGMYFANHYAADDTAANVQDFIKQFQEKYDGETPNSFAALGYDSAKILFEALKQVDTAAANAESASDENVVPLGATPESYAAVIEALKKTDMDCITGHITFDANNNPIKECTIICIEDGAYHFETKI